MVIHSKKFLLSSNSTPVVNWFAWTNGTTTIYTQTDKPEAVCDWIFTAPNVIGEYKISSVAKAYWMLSGSTFPWYFSLKYPTQLKAGDSIYSSTSLGGSFPDPWVADCSVSSVDSDNNITLSNGETFKMYPGNSWSDEGNYIEDLNAIIVNNEYYYRDSQYDSTDSITAFYFTIKTDAYTSGNTSFEIPINQTSYINPIIVNWGDGTTETINNVSYPAHTYETAGTYQIKISADSGLMPYFYYKDKSSRQYISCDSAFLTSYNGTSLVTSWSGWEPFGYYASNLQYVASTMFKLNPKITYMAGIFAQSGLLKVPKNILKYCPKLQRLSNTFASTKITAVPEGFFDTLTNLSDASYCFSNNHYLVDVPDKIFKDNKKLSRAEGVFQSCTSVTLTPLEMLNRLLDGTDYIHYGSICVARNSCRHPKSTTEYLTPEYLAKYYELYSCFYECCEGWLLTEIPAGIFDNYPNVRTFSNAFHNCQNLVTIPDYLFRYNTAATDFSYCFYQSYKIRPNPNIFCDEATEMATRFKDVSPRFSYCFGNSSTDSSVTAGAVPQLWNYTYPYGMSVVQSTTLYVVSFDTSTNTFVCSNGNTYRQYSYYSYVSGVGSIYTWRIKDSTSTEYLYVNSSSVSSTMKLFELVSVMGAKVEKSGCFSSMNSAKVTNYSSIPTAWGGTA